jgi:hypothetical protein
MIRRSEHRFADKIMRHVDTLARDRTQNRCPFLLIARRLAKRSAAWQVVPRMIRQVDRFAEQKITRRW